MTYTPTEQQIEKAAFAVFAVGLDLSDPKQRQLAEAAWADMGGSGMDGERAMIEADARAVLVAVGPSIAAGALRGAADPKAATWPRGMYGSPDDMFSRRDLLNRADQIEQEDRA